ncbi:MAG: GNAT family N-acetyltransferase [archaeon YNP-LCB-003-016]|uniref:GNAT family N-acetyltransferase n=1 Tax=Candidatus Culexarchaeum yellowstonense TaxID=2928963 RepID=UPI0026EB4777|nr:GNAT family N-acetyltransferase [Candidatus Culexarchaeum yellowstonense]MCR6692891.1 GNAT family N-acetyltransferase [Candidatus Culexarchaeum yellowstonense]
MNELSGNLCILPMEFSEFNDWYKELSKLRIFWAKPLNNVNLISTDSEKCLLEIEWIVRRKIKKAIMCISKSPSKAFEVIRKSGYESITKLLMIPEDSILSSSYNINARSILYFWDVHSKVLEPNNKVRIVKLWNWSNEDLEIFNQIHKKSWGFFIPPRKDDHIIVLAYLKDMPVGMAYLNKHNFNIDYGVHIARNFWRNRIGTTILREVLNLSKRLNAKYVSVVRVLRSLRISSSDRRAILFYKANNPALKLNVCRVENCDLQTKD